MDQLWKGIVVEIRKAPSQKDAILNVTWFWAKRDIERVIKGKPIGEDLSGSVFIAWFLSVGKADVNPKTPKKHGEE